MKINDIVVFTDSPIHNGAYIIVADKANNYKPKSNPYKKEYSVPEDKDFILKPIVGNEDNINPISGIFVKKEQIRLKKD